MTSTKDQDYKHLLNDDTEGLEPESVEEEFVRHRRPRNWCFWFWMVLGNLVTFSATRAYYNNASWNRSSVEKLAEVDTYSPLYKGLDLHMDYTSVGGDLWGNDTNIWRGSPSPAVDEAWDSITASRYTLVTKDEILKLNKPTEESVQWPYDPSGDSYLVEINAYHVLHCLNEMRKNAYVNFDYYFGGGRPLNPIHWDHFSHCLDILRQEIMCRPSLHVTSMIWQERQSRPFPEFRTNRMCARWSDFDAYIERRRPNHDDLLRMVRLPKPQGAVERPAPPEARELLHRNSEWLKKMIAEGYDLHDG